MRVRPPAKCRPVPPPKICRQKASHRPQGFSNRREWGRLAERQLRIVREIRRA